MGLRAGVEKYNNLVPQSVYFRCGLTHLNFSLEN